MNAINDEGLLTEEEATQEATADYLQEHYKSMTPDMAALWARSIQIEEEARIDNDPMAPKLRDAVNEARDNTRSTLRKVNEKMIQNGFRESLENNDYFEAMSYLDVAKKLKLDLGDILAKTPTKIDRQALLEGFIPLSAIS